MRRHVKHVGVSHYVGVPSAYVSISFHKTGLNFFHYVGVQLDYVFASSSSELLSCAFALYSYVSVIQLFEKNSVIRFDSSSAFSNLFRINYFMTIFVFQSFWLCASSIFDSFSFLCMTCQLSSSWFHYHLLNHHPKETVWSEKRLRLWLFNEHLWTFTISTQSEIRDNVDQTVCDKFHWRSGIFYHKSTQHVNLNRFDNIILS